MAIEQIPSNNPSATTPTATGTSTGDGSYSITASNFKVHLKQFHGDDPLEHSLMDNNFEVLRRKINELITEVETLKALHP